tara:strand:+ start:274 stop:1065 length:792 start_codon:yes stop_codon:yes gene_type:complete
MARSLLDVVHKSIKKAGFDAYEPSDVPFRALILAKIAENEEKGDSMDNVKTVFENKILFESRMNGAKETGRAFIYTESRILCALVDSSAIHIRNILSRMEEFCRVSGGQNIFYFARVLSIHKIPPCQSKDSFRDYQTKVVTKFAQEQEQKRQEQEEQQAIVEEQAQNLSMNIEEDEASETSSLDEEEKEEDQKGVARATCIETCVGLISDILAKKSRIGPMNYDFDSLLESEFIPTLEGYLNLFESKCTILNRDDDFIFPLVS